MFDILMKDIQKDRNSENNKNNERNSFISQTLKGTLIGINMAIITLALYKGYKWTKQNNKDSPFTILIPNSTHTINNKSIDYYETYK